MADFNLEAMPLKELRQLQKDLAKAFGVTDGQISGIVRGIKWATAGGPIQTERKCFRG